MLSCHFKIEDSWNACEELGLEIEWAGELIERKWGRAMKGGIRPVNGPFGHTAFLLFAIKLIQKPYYSRTFRTIKSEWW